MKGHVMRTLLTRFATQSDRTKQYFWPLTYFTGIVVSNLLMIWLPMMPLAGTMIPPAIFAFGFVFVLRDFAQRQIGHHVLLFMAAAAVVTFVLAGPAIASASVTAFVISELVDWAAYTLLRRPLRQRVLISSLVSVPVDTAVFFLALGILDFHSLIVGVIVKMIATIAVWLYLTIRGEVRV
jgi:uncharacterized PurR-regulated membrane protein YhhQ (DUF165 family)